MFAFSCAGGGCGGGAGTGAEAGDGGGEGATDDSPLHPMATTHVATKSAVPARISVD